MDCRKLVKEQLGEGFAFKKAYTAFENGELRIIATENTNTGSSILRKARSSASTAGASQS
jgi:hypothetical protein